MKTVLTIMIALFTVITALGQTVVKKETIILTDTQEDDFKQTIVDLSKKLQASLNDDESLNKGDIKDLKQLLTAIADNLDENENHHKVIIRKGDSSENTSISYAISIDSDGEIKTGESIKEIDITELKEKLKEVSEVVHESENLKVIIKKLGDSDIIIKEEEKEKTKKQ
ncbi:hypothetical protein [Dokdonia sp.]|uniref:hypothetical protein n=1 Tax=Dokdonia sp. TaxID=2024995 RepID=UPI0032644753